MDVVSNETLDPLLLDLPKTYDYETDPNSFPYYVTKTQILEDSYYSYSKDRKIRNGVYSLKLQDV